MELRHEWKHQISPMHLCVLRQRLRAVMTVDPHAKDGVYTIRSLYFDTPADTALREKLDGVSFRQKFRIRYYNGDLSLLHLEKKTKLGGLGNKQTADLTLAEASALSQGRTEWMAAHPAPLVRELYRGMTLQGLRPKTIVDYIREPFTFAPGNVRVTLDYGIRTGLSCTDFLDPACPTVPVPGSPIILEVKWDEFLPDVIRDLIQLESRRSAAYSKYAACRVYG